MSKTSLRLLAVALAGLVAACGPAPQNNNNGGGGGGGGCTQVVNDIVLPRGRRPRGPGAAALDPPGAGHYSMRP